MKLNYVKTFFLFLLFLTIKDLSFYASANYKRTNITTRNGLSQNDISCIYQDQEGFIWIGTNDGLNRYDGYEYKTYRSNNSNLKSILILSIAEDHQGNLWIGTADKGLFVYLKEEDNFYALQDLVKGQNCPSSGTRLAIDKDNNIWSLNGENYNIYCFHFDKKSHQATIIKAYTKNNYADFHFTDLVANDNGVFISGNQGVYQLNNKNHSLIRVGDFNSWSPDLEVVNHNTLLVQTKENLYLYNCSTKKSTLLYRNIPDKGLMAYAKNTLWFSGEKGVYKATYNPIKQTLEPWIKMDQYNHLITRSIMIDREGSLWTGYLKQGIYKYSKNHKPFLLFNQIGNNHFSSLFQQDKNLWIGTEGSGAFLTELKNNKIHILNQLCKDRIVYDIKFIPYLNKLAISTEGYPLLLTDLKGKETTNYLLDVINSRTLLVDSCYLWLGNYHHGLYRYNMKEDKLQHYLPADGLPSVIVRNIMMDTKHNIWVATSKGLCIIPKKENTAKGIKIHSIINPELQNDYVLSILQDHNQHIWYSTLGNGLRKIKQVNPDYSVIYESYSQENGLSSNAIKAIEEDEEYRIWCSSNKGLNRINPQTHAVRVYDINDGLQDFEFNEFSSLKLSDQRLLFGGVRGINLFDPIHIKNDTTKSYPIITDFLVYNKSIQSNANYHTMSNKAIPLTDKITLTYQQNTFTLTFSALHFSNPHKNKFKYRLKNIDSEWVTPHTDIHEVTYSHLAPGTYNFELQASNGDHIWNSNTRKLQIVITPPFWATWYAYIFYGILIILTLLQILRTNKRRIERRYMVELAHLEKKKSEDLLEMKTRFFTNISHEFRTPLTLILSPIQTLLNDPELAKHKKWAKALPIMEHNGKILMRLINELMNFSKLEKNKLKLSLSQNDFIQVSQTICNQFNYWAKQKQIHLKCILPDEPIIYAFDPNLMEQIIYNLLSNAIKHTPTGGTVCYKIENYTDYFILKIADSGEGLSPEALTHVFERFYSKYSDVSKDIGGTGIGLHLTKSLIEMHKGTIWIKSEEGKGTTFFVKMPKFVKNLKAINIQENKNEALTTPIPAQVTKIIDTNKNNEKEEKKTQKLTLLLIDDYPDLLQLLTNLFKDEYLIKTATNGQEAWDRLDNLLPDLIISDIMMPHLNGLQLCEKIKNDERYAHIPIILLTAKSTKQDVAQGYYNDADGYCSKPFNNTVLKNMVRSILSNRQKMALHFREHFSLFSNEIKTTASDEKFMKKLLEYIKLNLANSDLVVDHICQHMGISSTILNKKLKSLVGLTTNAFIRHIRLKAAAEMLTTGEYNVTDVTYAVGFSDLKYFRECFKKEFGTLPQKYKTEHMPK